MPNMDDELRRLKEVLEIPERKEWEATIRLLTYLEEKGLIPAIKE